MSRIPVAKRSAEEHPIMHSSPRVLAAILFGVLSTTGALSAQSTRGDESDEISRDVKRVRTATAAFKSLDAAVAAGYARNGGGCVQNQPHGAMGYHHVNESLLDDRIEIDQPEMLVYERLPDGTYRLNGVEYIVPFSVRPVTAEPPTVMGQPLNPAPSLEIWYRHVWIWLDNPSGLFADWNPDVHCRS
jgi:hypothetical protein